MTAHYIPDTLIYKGEEYVPYDDIALFSSYLEQHQIELLKDMWTFRGYVAKWEIRDNMLFLVDLKALLPKRCCKPVRTGLLFPQSKDSIGGLVFWGVDDLL